MADDPLDQQSGPLSDAQLSALFIEACDAELSALKPGNVHVFAGGHRMEPRHFEVSARTAAPFVADSRLGLGERIEDAMRATFAAAQCNTNLGILLLCAPLAVAASRHDLEGQALRARLGVTLNELSQADAAHVYEAIRIANPAGLGSADEGDVQDQSAPDLTLSEAMALAAPRDRIAAAYGDEFAEIFEFGLPRLTAGLEREGSLSHAITRLHMAFLSAQPDSHIARKFGIEMAISVQNEMRARHETLDRDHPDLAAPEAHAFLMGLDHSLKERGLNPGTTADLVVATVFAWGILRNMRPLAALKPLSKA